MIDSNDIERLKEIFVTRRECDDRTEALESRIGDNVLELALIRQKLDQISWVSKTTLGAVIAALVGVLVKVIF